MIGRFNKAYPITLSLFLSGRSSLDYNFLRVSNARHGRCLLRKQGAELIRVLGDLARARARASACDARRKVFRMKLLARASVVSFALIRL